MIKNKVCRYKNVRLGGHGYYLDLDYRHELWSRLDDRHRHLAKKMGAEEAYDVYCPEFSNVSDLIAWIDVILGLNDLDSVLKIEIKRRMKG